MAHTPTPYSFEELYSGIIYVRSKHNGFICKLDAGSAQELGTNRSNAEFIVRACNSHDDLVAALEDAINTLEWVFGCTSPNMDEFEKGIERAKNSLAEAKAVQPLTKEQEDDCI